MASQTTTGKPTETSVTNPAPALFHDDDDTTDSSSGWSESDSDNKNTTEFVPGSKPAIVTPVAQQQQPPRSAVGMKRPRVIEPAANSEPRKTVGGKSPKLLAKVLAEQKKIREETAAAKGITAMDEDSGEDDSEDDMDDQRIQYDQETGYPIKEAIKEPIVAKPTEKSAPTRVSPAASSSNSEVVVTSPPKPAYASILDAVDIASTIATAGSSSSKPKTVKKAASATASASSSSSPRKQQTKASGNTPITEEKETKPATKAATGESKEPKSEDKPKKPRAPRKPKTVVSEDKPVDGAVVVEKKKKSKSEHKKKDADAVGDSATSEPIKRKRTKKAMTAEAKKQSDAENGDNEDDETGKQGEPQTKRQKTGPAKPKKRASTKKTKTLDGSSKETDEAAAVGVTPPKTKKYTPKAKRSVLWGPKLPGILSKPAAGDKPAAYSVERNGFTVVRRLENGAEDYRTKFMPGYFVIMYESDNEISASTHKSQDSDSGTVTPPPQPSTSSVEPKLPANGHNTIWQVGPTFLDEVSKATATRVRQIVMVSDINGVPKSIPTTINDRPTIVATNRCKLLKNPQQYIGLTLIQVATDIKDKDAIEKSRYVFLKDDYAAVNQVNSSEAPSAVDSSSEDGTDNHSDTKPKEEITFTFLDQNNLDEDVDWIAYLGENHFTTPTIDALFRHERGWCATKERKVSPTKRPRKSATKKSDADETIDKEKTKHHHHHHKHNSGDDDEEDVDEKKDASDSHVASTLSTPKKSPKKPKTIPIFKDKSTKGDDKSPKGDTKSTKGDEQKDEEKGDEKQKKDKKKKSPKKPKATHKTDDNKEEKKGGDEEEEPKGKEETEEKKKKRAPKKQSSKSKDHDEKSTVVEDSDEKPTKPTKKKSKTNSSLIYTPRDMTLSIAAFKKLRALVSDIPDGSAPNWDQIVKINTLALKSVAPASFADTSSHSKHKHHKE